MYRQRWKGGREKGEGWGWGQRKGRQTDKGQVGNIHRQTDRDRQ